MAAIDRSKYKEKIIDYAISLGKAWGAEVTAIHVIDPGRGVHAYTFTVRFGGGKAKDY
ncbi:MAG: universal stress protein [Candidatus Nitrosopolaris sp.]